MPCVTPRSMRRRCTSRSCARCLGRQPALDQPCRGRRLYHCALAGTAAVLRPAGDDTWYCTGITSSRSERPRRSGASRPWQHGQMVLRARSPPRSRGRCLGQRPACPAAFPAARAAQRRSLFSARPPLGRACSRSSSASCQLIGVGSLLRAPAELHALQFAMSGAAARSDPPGRGAGRARRARPHRSTSARHSEGSSGSGSRLRHRRRV